jgi:hypothetical protein
MIFSGMPPESIKNPEQRQAYLTLLAKRSENSRMRNWLIGAEVDHRSLVRLLDDMTRNLVSSGNLAEVTRTRAMERIQRKQRNTGTPN